MGEPRRWRVRVRHYEVDEYGHVNHANYVHYLETARIEALEAVGLSLQEMRRRGVTAVAVDLAVKYHSPAGPGDTLEIVTHVSGMRGARTRWVQEIRDEASGRLVATGEVTGAFLSEAGRPLRAPHEFRERLQLIYVPDETSGPEARAPMSGPEERPLSRDACPTCHCRDWGLHRMLRSVLRGRR